MITITDPSPQSIVTRWPLEHVTHVEYVILNTFSQLICGVFIVISSQTKAS